MAEYVKTVKFLSYDTRMIPHPLALLTACSNDRWWWDYYDCNINYSFVWRWAWDKISFTQDYKIISEWDYSVILTPFIESNNLKSNGKSKISE